MLFMSPRDSTGGNTYLECAENWYGEQKGCWRCVGGCEAVSGLCCSSERCPLLAARLAPLPPAALRRLLSRAVISSAFLLSVRLSVSSTASPVVPEWSWIGRCPGAGTAAAQAVTSGSGALRCARDPRPRWPQLVAAESQALGAASRLLVQETALSNLLVFVSVGCLVIKMVFHWQKYWHLNWVIECKL